MHRKIMRRSRVIRINLDGVTVFGQVAFINSRIGFQGICVTAERLSTDFVMNQEKLIEACQCDGCNRSAGNGAVTFADEGACEIFQGIPEIK